MEHLLVPGKPAPVMPEVYYYTLGDPLNASAPGNVWRTASQWPPIGVMPLRMWLQKGGGLGIIPSAPGMSEFTADPRHPCPTVGGRNLIPTSGVGPYDQAPLVESRPDVAVFTTPVLQTALEVRARRRIYCILSQ